MSTYYLAIGVLGTILLNIIASVISKNWSLNITPHTKLGRVIVHIYIWGTVVVALLYLLQYIRASSFLTLCIGGQIVWQLYTAIWKFLPNNRVQATTHNLS